MALPTAHVGGVDFWLRIHSLSTGNSWRLPLIKASVTYAVNQIPQAVLHVPAGAWFGEIAGGSESEFGDLIYEVPQMQKAYEVTVPVDTDSNPDFKDIFWGYVQSPEQVRAVKYRGGRHVIRLNCRGTLGLLQGGPAGVIGNRGAWSGPGEVYNGFGLTALGLPLGSGISDLAGGSVSPSHAMISALYGICDDIVTGSYGPLTRPSALARDTIYEIARWAPTAWPIDSSLSSECRESIAYSVAQFINAISTPKANIWQSLLAFCSHFNHQIIPTVEQFDVTPALRVAKEPLSAIPNISSDQISTLSTQHLSPEMDDGAAAYMHTREETNPLFGLTSGTRTYSMAARFARGDGDRVGSVVKIDPPKWFDPSLSGSEDIARRLCMQRAIDEVFKTSQLTVKLRGQLYEVLPGTLLHLHDFGTLTPITEGGVYGRLKSVNWTLDAESPQMTTSLVLTHVMDDQAMAAADTSLRNAGLHCLTGPYFYATGENTGLDQWQGDVWPDGPRYPTW